MQRNATISFLKCVLPGEGYYCAVMFRTAHPKAGVDKPVQKFFSTIEELADFLLANDQQGRTVYHACATYSSAGKRTQSNAAFARSFWLDIDCHPSGFKNRKPCYVDKQAAAEAVLGFCAAVGLPVPLFVDSGGGIHCYWPLADALTPAQWGVYSAGLKAACVQHNLLTDPARTADVASILRTPGTHNRKEGEVLVQFDPAGCQPHSFAAFEHLARSAAVGGDRTSQVLPRHPTSRPERSVSASGRPSVIQRARAADAASFAAVRSDFVADRCAQVDALRQSGGVEGWFLRVGVLAFCVDGDQKAHEWSEHDYPEYDPAVVDDRLQRSRALTGATTCARLDSASPGVCQSCPFWGRISSPINIPADPLDVRLPPTGRTPFPGGANGHHLNGHSVAAQLLPTIGGIELPELPSPFKWLAGGKLAFATETPKGDPLDLIVSDFPVFLDTVQTGELDTTRFSYKFRRYLPQEGWGDIVVDAKTVFAASGAAELADRGMVLHEHKHFLNYVRHAVTEFHEDEETRIRYDQFGWKNNDTAFLYGKHLYTPAGPVEAIGAKEVQTRGQWIGPRKNGNLHAWTEAADALFAADMESYSTMVLASFAAPLMRFQSADEGGAILHLFTPASGQGKTTALTGAWTVWGNREGLSLTNDDTRVSKPIAIGTLANLPVIYDELQNRDPEEIKRFVVMFTEGRDRMRGMVDGTIRHTKGTWQTLLLSASNNSLVDQLQGEGVDAPAYRVLELHSKLPRIIDKTKGDRLKKILTDNAGHAGDAYLRYLTNPTALEWAKKALEQWTQEIWDHSRLESAHRFRVRAVGAIAVAAKICEKLDLLHFNTDRIVTWLIENLGSSANMPIGRALTNERAAEVLGIFINAHMNEVLIVPDKYKPKHLMVPLRAPQNRLSIRYEIATGRVFIADTVFRDWAVKNGVAPRHLVAELQQNQVITSSRRMMTLSAGTNLPGAQTACIEINAEHPAMSGLVASVDTIAARAVS